jgi:hypothetical protein
MAPRIFLFLASLLSLGAGAQPTLGPTFNRELEFPNHFLPKNFASLSPSEQATALKESRELLEQAMASIGKRLMVPVAIPGAPKGELQNVRYFDYITEAAKKIDPTARVMPSGGVVRSLLGYLYEEMHNFAELNPDSDPLENLRRIAGETRDIEAIEVRGVGGDFDVLIKSRSEHLGDIKNLVTSITNSAEDSLNARDDDVRGAKRMLFTIGDVKDYESQTQRSTAQGGSTIDFLAFDIEHGRFVEPDGHDYIVDDFLRGTYRYLEPQRGQKRESFEKQVIRGVRPLIELPFLDLDAKSAKQFERELRILIAQLKKDGKLDAKALEQVGKAIRNGRRALGNNRVVRAGSEVEKLIRELSDELAARGLERIPEYVDHAPIGLRDPLKKSELNGFPRELLTPIEDFIAKRSTNGILSHGTPTLDNAMAMMRGGIYYSGGRYGQGTFMQGGGGYAGSSDEAAKHFEKGFTLHLEIRNDPRVNAVIDSPKFQKWIKTHNIEAKAKALNMDTHQYLQRYHGIDFIAKESVLILNTGALDLGDPQTRIATVLNSLKGGDLRGLFGFEKLRAYAIALGIKVPPLKDSEWIHAIEESTKKSELNPLLWFTRNKGEDFFRERPSILQAVAKATKDFKVENNHVATLVDIVTIRKLVRDYGGEVEDVSAQSWKDAFDGMLSNRGNYGYSREIRDAPHWIYAFQGIFEKHPEVLEHFLEHLKGESPGNAGALIAITTRSGALLEDKPALLKELMFMAAKSSVSSTARYFPIPDAMANLAEVLRPVFPRKPKALLEFIEIAAENGRGDALLALDECCRDSISSSAHARKLMGDRLADSLIAENFRSATVLPGRIEALLKKDAERLEHYPEAQSRLRKLVRKAEKLPAPEPYDFSDESKVTYLLSLLEGEDVLGPNPSIQSSITQDLWHRFERLSPSERERYLRVLKLLEKHGHFEALAKLASSFFDIDNNPEIIVALMRIPNEKVHEGLAQRFAQLSEQHKQNRKILDKVYRRLLRSGRAGHEALINAARFRKIDFINQKLDKTPLTGIRSFFCDPMLKKIAQKYRPR